MGQLTLRPRLAAVAVVAAVVIAVLIIVLLPGEPCSTWNGWRWVADWPKPHRCI